MKKEMAAKAKEIKVFFKENNVTRKQMDAMWAYLYDKNPIIKNLTNHQKSWNNLNTLAMKSLITQYNKQELPKNFNLLQWYDGYVVVQKLIKNENKETKNE